ncbi:MAG: MATE family efflux transporter [Clostridia bacterium]|nr:MATE family efflux transporter [Clostridia bacterium]
MRIQLSDHFTYKKLLRFVLSPILMMIFTSIYGVIDGLFISNFVGEDAFAAVNLIMPVLMIMGSIGFMIGTGGTAIVSKLLGEGDKENANRYFSLFIFVTVIGGVFFAVLGEILIPYIPKWLNASENTYGYCVLYGRILLAAMPAFMLQNVFQAFFSTAEKPMLGFIVTAIAGCTNILLDGVLVGAVNFGVTGAAVATLASQVVGAVLPIFYFSIKNNSLLRLGKPKFKWKVLLDACTNGSSEFVNNISSSIVSIVFNYQLIRLVGDMGVSAYGVLMYVNFIYFSIFIGYSIGVAPLIGYNYGADNREELKNIFRKSVIIVEVFGVLMTALALGLAYPISWLFVRKDAALLEMTENAFYVISYMFIFAGFSVFSSSMFTAFGNGLISALISFLRTIVFQIAAVLILPIWFGLKGVWVAALIPEVLAMLTSLLFVILKRKKYGYA